MHATKKLLVYARHCDNSTGIKIKTTYLGNIAFSEAKVDAALIFQYVEEFLKERGVPLSKVIGFGSDGASVMTGRNKRSGYAHQRS